MPSKRRAHASRSGMGGGGIQGSFCNAQQASKQTKEGARKKTRIRCEFFVFVAARSHCLGFTSALPPLFLTLLLLFFLQLSLRDCVSLSLSLSLFFCCCFLFSWVRGTREDDAKLHPSMHAWHVTWLVSYHTPSSYTLTHSHSHTYSYDARWTHYVLGMVGYSKRLGSGHFFFFLS